MTVEELIKKLQKCPPDLPVFYRKESYFEYPISVEVHWMNEYDVVEPDECDEDEELTQAVVIW